MTQLLSLRPREECRYELVALGEVMLRFDPGDGSDRDDTHVPVSEGGGEYNVARGLRRCFGLRTGDRHGARRQSDRPADRGPDPAGRRRAGAARLARRTTGSAVRCATVSTSPSAASAFAELSAAPIAANSAASQLQPGDVDWERIFGVDGVRWFHTGGVFCGALRDVRGGARARGGRGRAPSRHGRLVRPELPPVAVEGTRRRRRGGRGQPRARRARRRPVRERGGLLRRARLPPGRGGRGPARARRRATTSGCSSACSTSIRELALVASTLRQARTATINDWSAVCRTREGFHVGPRVRRARDLRPRRRRRLVRLRADLRAARGLRRPTRRSPTASHTARSR